MRPAKPPFMPVPPAFVASRRRLALAAAALAVSAGLAGCASPGTIAVGQTAAQVTTAHGRPQAEYPLPDGRRLEYVQDGFQQDVFMVDLDAEGRVRAVRSVRNEVTFAQIRPGTDTRESIARLLGTPERTYEFPRMGETAWLYPYRESGVWYSALAVYFDARGTVTRTENGPDPRFVGGRGDRND